MDRKQRGADAKAGVGADPAGAVLAVAIQYHQSGRLDEAANLYRKILAADPRHATANHLLGLIAHQQGRNAEAVELISKAIASTPAVPAFHSNLGVALVGMGRVQEALAAFDTAVRLKPDYANAYDNRGKALRSMGRLDEALAAFDTAVKLKPDYAISHNNRGKTLRNMGRLDEALAACDTALCLQPDFAGAHSNRGNALHGMGRFEESLAAYDSAVRLKPDFAEAHSNRANALYGMGRFDESLAACDTALRLKPDFAEAHSNRANALFRLGRFEESLAAYNTALRLKPDFAEAHSNRANALHGLGRFEESLAASDTALRLKPDFAGAHSNRANALHGMGRFEESLAACDTALRLKPDFAEAYSNRGNALYMTGRFEESLAAYDASLRLKPDFSDALYNRSLLKLRLREFDEGFSDYKYRWKTVGFPGKPLKTNLPSISKSERKGRLLLWAEQGIGDEIFYAGLVPDLLAKDVDVTLSANHRLHSVYNRSFPGVALLDSNAFGGASIDNGYDAQAPIGDLGSLLDLDATSIQATRSPYLRSDPIRRDGYRKALPSSGSGLICGIAWKSVNPKIGAAKSVDLASFAPLLTLQGVDFVNLQYGDVKDQIAHVKSAFGIEIHEIPELDVFNDIDGLLALIDACDVVVTTSNVTAHLAGSIGKRAAVLVPYRNGRIWYWHENDEYSFWYPSLRLFYQNDPLTWDQTIKDCADWMKRIL